MKKRKLGEKKQYAPPSVKLLDLKSAEALLEAKGQPDDPVVQEMLDAIRKAMTKTKKAD